MLVILQWLTGLSVVMVLWAFLVEPNWYRLRRMRISNQQKLKTPFTVLHLSDIHFVKRMGLKHHFFQRLSMLNPDLIFVTGDVIDNNDGIETAAKCLSGLRARYGTYLVLGNHDYYDYQAADNIRYHLKLAKRSPHRNDVGRLVETMKRVGVTVLVNQSCRLNVHGNSVTICGTDDPVTRKVDFQSTLKGIGSDTFNVMLMHQLDGVLEMPNSFVDLIFSGHTHGGQIRVPFLGAVFCDTKLPRQYVEGLHDYKGITVYVSRGTGAGRHVFPRLWCRPEAVFFEVHP